MLNDIIQDHRNFWYEDDSGTQRKNPLIGHKIPRPSHEEYYDIFVQSTGSGARHLPAGSRLLYSKVYWYTLFAIVVVYSTRVHCKLSGSYTFPYIVGF